LSPLDDGHSCAPTPGYLAERNLLFFPFQQVKEIPFFRFSTKKKSHKPTPYQINQSINLTIAIFNIEITAIKTAQPDLHF
jgi:hypothetical protein